MAGKLSKNGRAALLRAIEDAQATLRMCQELLQPDQPDWRILAHPSAVKIRKWLDDSTAQRLSTTDVLVNALGVEPAAITSRGRRQVGLLMAALGWDRRRNEKWFYDRPTDSAPGQPRGPRAPFR